MRIASLMLIVLLAISTNANAANPREEFKQAVEQLRATPADNSLRERIVNMAIGLKPPPAVPEEARRAFVKGNSAFTDAKTPEEVDRAISLYREASSLAPWWADVYFNLAKAFEQRQSFADAISTLKLYLMAKPADADARLAQDKVYALEDKIEREAKAAQIKRAEEERKSKAQKLAHTLLGYLQRQFGSSRIRMVTFCFSPSGGNYCSEEEARGNNWGNVLDNLTGSKDWSGQNLRLRVELNPNNMNEIRFEIPRQVMGDLCGTIQGSSWKEIRWEVCSQSSPPVKSSPVKLEEWYAKDTGRPVLEIAAHCDSNGRCQRTKVFFE